MRGPNELDDPAQDQDQDWTRFVPTFESQWSVTPGCPFCGSEDKKLESWWHRTKGKGARQLHKVTCGMCGSSGASGDTPAEALSNWSGRPSGSYHPLGENSFVLPDGRHLVVLEKGNISLVEYGDGEKNSPDEIVSQVDVNLGNLRISRWVREREKWSNA